MTLAAVLQMPCPVRRAVYQIGDVTTKWQRCAVECEPGVWLWECSEMDRIRINRHKARGAMVTTVERRDDGEFWLLVRWVR